MGTLTLVGLGLDPKGLPTAAIQSIKAASKAYIERYTAPVDDHWVRQVEDQVGRPITEIRRTDLEEGSVLIKEAKVDNIVLLSPGDPLIATTHTDLKIRARRAGIEVKVIHAPSVVTAVVGELGLHIYNIGRVVTATPGPMQTLYHTVHANLRSGLHTLILVSELSFRRLIEVLEEAERENGEGVFHEQTFLLVASNVGRDTQVLAGGDLGRLREKELPDGPFTVVVTGRLHFSEVEALTTILGLSEAEIRDNTRGMKSVSRKMLSAYVPKTRSALADAHRVLGGNSRYAALLENVECYTDDAEKFLEQGKNELAVLSIGYAEGLLDSLRFLGELEVRW